MVAIAAGVVVVFRFRQQIQKFISEVAAELKKVSWTNKKELFESAWVVLVSSALLGVFIALTDLILSRFIGVIIR
ncbi:MAG: preprotein translocase subunit SecE [Candidatus Omnitrophota bacterium]|nr:preprotein translocase subunit SecE [Candidatus Omnitrophota bacterium]